MPIRFASLALAALLAAPAGAEEPYFTLGAVAGRYAPAPPAGCTLDDGGARGAGATLGVGYRFANPFAVEFGWQTFGSLDPSATCPGPVTVALNAPDSGLTVSGVGRVALGERYALLGRIGAYSWSAAADSGTEAIVGIGLERGWRRGHALRLEYAAYGADLTGIHLTYTIGF